MTAQRKLRYAIQKALEDASGESTMVEGLEELTTALAIFVVAEGVDPETVKHGFDTLYSRFQAALGSSLTPAQS